VSAVPIEAALAAVAAACQVARAVADATTGVGEQTKADQSPVTIADFAVQAVIVHALRERGDVTPIVGEEDESSLVDDAALRDAVVAAVRVAWPEADATAVMEAIAAGHHRGDVGPYWALDPIDGTKGFLRREQYAVCLAYVDGSEPTIGVLGCPNLPRERGARLDDRSDAGAIYLAGPSGPAFEVGLDGLDVRPLVVDDPSSHVSRVGIRKGNDDVVITHSVDTGHTRLDRVQAVLDAMGRQFHAIPCDSQAKYALVARGQAHAYVRIPTNPQRVETVWDHAAGAAIATRAGMIVSDLRGAPLDFSSPRGLVNNYGIVCAHPSVHGELVVAAQSLGLAEPNV
jgi:3'(2'), 5'-bisphosphate nucleotidase